MYYQPEVTKTTMNSAENVSENKQYKYYAVCNPEKGTGCTREMRFHYEMQHPRFPVDPGTRGGYYVR